jgi:hypothetical protein
VIGRRAFAKNIAAAAVGAPLALAAEEKEKPPSALGKAMTAVVRAQSGQFLDAAEMERIGKDFEEYAGFLERFRAFKLTNSDEPDVTFSALARRW